MLSSAPMRSVFLLLSEGCRAIAWRARPSWSEAAELSASELRKAISATESRLTYASCSSRVTAPFASRILFIAIDPDASTQKMKSVPARSMNFFTFRSSPRTITPFSPSFRRFF